MRGLCVGVFHWRLGRFLFSRRTLLSALSLHFCSVRCPTVIKSRYANRRKTNERPAKSYTYPLVSSQEVHHSSSQASQTLLCPLCELWAHKRTKSMATLSLDDAHACGHAASPGRGSFAPATYRAYELPSGAVIFDPKSIPGLAGRNAASSPALCHKLHAAISSPSRDCVYRQAA